MKKLIKWIDKASDIGAYLSGLFMILIVLLILVEIFLRTFFKTSTLIADEYSAYFFVVVVMLGIPYTLRENGHIRISLVTSRLPEKIRKFFEILAILIALFLCIFICYHAILMVYDAYSLEMTADSIAETPIYIPQLVIPIGFILFALQFISELLKKVLK
jgi:TRAP-type C4-dicarboxylate transport system permease small subunit